MKLPEIMYMMGYKRALGSMVYKFFEKNTLSGAGVNEQLAEKFHKLVTKKQLK